jgi:DNA-binding transcriptional regulator GbsR (MarR family)
MQLAGAPVHTVFKPKTVNNEDADRVYALLRRAEYGLSIKDIHDETGFSRGKVSRMLDLLSGANRVRQISEFEKGVSGATWVAL